MTLEPYDAQELDRLVLRVLDITAIIRRMSVTAKPRRTWPWACMARRPANGSGNSNNGRLKFSPLGCGADAAEGAQAQHKNVQKSGRDSAQSEVAERPCAGLRQSRFRGEFADAESNERFGAR